MFKKNRSVPGSRDTRGEAPSLPDRSYNQQNLPPKVMNKPGFLSEQMESQPTRSTSPYPGTWKPQRRDVPPPPPVSPPPDRDSTDSYDDEYVVPGDLDNTENMPSHYPSQNAYWGQKKPKTPPLPPDFEDENYAAPDEITNGHTNHNNGYLYNQYQQNHGPSTPPLDDDLYIAPDDINPSEDTYDAPEDIPMDSRYQPSWNNNGYPYQPQPQSPASPPPPLIDIDSQEIYDAPDEGLPSPPAALRQDSIEDSYDIPENIDNRFSYGHSRGPSTPPLPLTPPLSPFDDQDVYDTPDRDDFIPPVFSPPPVPKAPVSKPIIPTPTSPEKDLPKKGYPINELTKRFAAMNRPQETPSQPPPTAPKSPSKRPIIRQNIPAPKSKPVPVVMNNLEDQIWFKLKFVRNTSEDFLRNYNIDGGFIVRPSTKDGPGNYSFSIFFQGEIRHLRIRRKDNNKYSVGEEKENELEFDSVLKCVEYHQEEPLILKAGGEVCLYVLQ